MLRTRATEDVSLSIGSDSCVHRQGGFLPQLTQRFADHLGVLGIDPSQDASLLLLGVLYKADQGFACNRLAVFVEGAGREVLVSHRAANDGIDAACGYTHAASNDLFLCVVYAQGELFVAGADARDSCC